MRIRFMRSRAVRPLPSLKGWISTKHPVGCTRDFGRGWRWAQLAGKVAHEPRIFRG